MAISVATVALDERTTLPLRVFVNRRKLASNVKESTLFETPLLSNNSLVSLKSPKTAIYLSNTDMESMCNAIKDDLLMIVYELMGPQVALSKLRVGQEKSFDSIYSTTEYNHEFIDHHIESITRLGKFKYKLWYKNNWELEIFLNNTLKLSRIRRYMLFRDSILHNAVNEGIHDKKQLLLMRQDSVDISKVPTENDLPLEDLPLEDLPSEDIKPEVNFRYKRMVNLVPCIDIHVLERPRRHKRQV
ncbi:DNA-binding protein SAW1 KNAG_0D04890 [Huiozyma naganishii CBS 8797]|uniref:Uncharacterized protein n=1 Tax=Huiozyma naganishii (strain ATCC MYA-139 / BCRC 22969 / CBS 8797 / KCTC 17520 / NBRC 10181 / NCYC 3082 / Yp74L-3) TaxID=1071383 RepID=J7RL47_HUIN7|nr:hypothetical protein KNAG_0D04890 [Kazachstania naganishii CBS 8797]CCK70228.1 hypothetical protein KNAG_0D04890 [Kazachstania naganishii CBS 8797]